jgi:hypothetical protein
MKKLVLNNVGLYRYVLLFYKKYLNTLERIV